MGDMVKIYELLINVVNAKKPNMLLGFNQNGNAVMNVDLTFLIHGNIRLSAERKDLNHLLLNRWNVLNQYCSKWLYY